MDRQSAEWERVEKSSYPLFEQSTHGSRNFQSDLYVGGSVDLNGYTYHILDAQDKTFTYMEDHITDVSNQSISISHVCALIIYRTSTRVCMLL